MALVPVRSLPLFAFANDGAVAWLRASGPRLLAVDARSGQVLRELALDPAPFGVAWRIERVGDVFVVRDDREIAAYADASGTRLWRRTSPLRVAFAGKRGDRHITVATETSGDGIDLIEADLATGDFAARLHVAGSMQHVGPNGALRDDLVVVVTDEKEVVAIDTATWRIVARHVLAGAYVLPPVVTPRGLHVASVERHSRGATTRVYTLDPATGQLVSTEEVGGAALELSAGAAGLVLDVHRSTGTLERVAFRPESPQVKLVVSKHVDMSLLPDIRPSPPRRFRRPVVDLLAMPSPIRKRPASANDVILPPAPATATEGRESVEPTSELPSAHSAGVGLRALLAIMGADSTCLTKIADALRRDPRRALALGTIGLRFRDPRIRWSAWAGRDPCLVDLAEHTNGDTIATYWYPAARTSCVPVVRVSKDTGKATWLADDIDAWLAEYIADARCRTPDFACAAIDAIGIGDHEIAPAPPSLPPSWFFEVHDTGRTQWTRWTIADADEAFAAGDLHGAERILVAIGVRGDAREAKAPLAEVYTVLGWPHQRALVAETW